jgi:hypothetical protein
MLGLVDWTAIDWDALATLLTGVLAVGGAVYVGRKQVGISERQVGISERQVRISEKQTDILARQADVAEMSLREAIFDRRIAVYDATRKLIRSIVSEGKPPSIKILEEFTEGLLDAQFLFSPPVQSALDGIWRKLSDLNMHKAMMKSTDRKDIQKHVTAESEALKWFFDKLGTLPDDFGEELRLAPPVKQTA